MIVRALVLVVAIVVWAFATRGTDAKQEADPLKKFSNVRVDEKNFAKIRNMHVNWYAAAIKALMSQLGKELFEKLDPDEQRLLLRCLDKIDDRRDLVESARCLVVARKRFKRVRGSKPAQKPKQNAGWMGGFRVRDTNDTPMSGNSTATTTKPPMANANNSSIAPIESSPVISRPINATHTPLPTKIRRPIRIFDLALKSHRVFDEHSTTFSKRRNPFESLRRKGPKLMRDAIVDPRVGRGQQNAQINIRQIAFKARDSPAKRHLEPTRWPKRIDYRTPRARRRRRRSLSWFRAGSPKAGMFHDSDTTPAATHEEPWKVRQAKEMSGLVTSKDRSPVSRITNLISMFVRTPTQEDSEMRSARQRAERWSHTYNRLLTMKKAIDEKEKSPGAKVYSLRMYDLVIGNDQPTMSSKQSRTSRGLVEMAMDLFSRVGGDKMKAERSKSNSKFLSPRFAPVMPDKVQADKSELSPTILAFYEEPNNTATNIASIPQILKATGMEKKDRDAVIGTIMDVSGARDTVEDALGMLESLNFFGIEGEIMGATEMISSIYDTLEKSLKPAQNKELRKRGFAFLDMNQINKVYRDPALKVPEEAMDFDVYGQLTPELREESLWRTIERIAINKPEEPVRNKNLTAWDAHRRTKRGGSLTVPSVLAPVILAPFMFSPIFGLSVLGPTILSPSLFSPLILNPCENPEIFQTHSYEQMRNLAVLGPFILSPAVGIPFIISPYLLSPYILSPLVFGPDVVSPMALGGAILSPSVASPAVFTETYLMANVLSPSFLS